MKHIKCLCYITLIPFFTIHWSFSQINLPDPDAILVGKRELPTVLLVGTFHFSYYNFDTHKTSKEEQVDVLARQKEVEELVDYIARFKPTKIAVESGRNTGKILNNYRAYRSGKKDLDRDEMEQIGFRLIKKFNLDTLYGINDRPLVMEFYDGKDSLAFRPVLDTMYADWDFQSNDNISTAYAQYNREKDKWALHMSLLDFFKYINSDKALDRGFGSYLIGDFKLGNTRGADALSLHWYNRNLRIYRHIQQISTSAEDRILVIFGSGHVEILKHLFQCSPEFKLIKFNDL